MKQEQQLQQPDTLSGSSAPPNNTNPEMATPASAALIAMTMALDKLRSSIEKMDASMENMGTTMDKMDTNMNTHMEKITHSFGTLGGTLEKVHATLDKVHEAIQKQDRVTVIQSSCNDQLQVIQRQRSALNLSAGSLQQHSAPMQQPYGFPPMPAQPYWNGTQSATSSMQPNWNNIYRNGAAGTASVQHTQDRHVSAPLQYPLGHPMQPGVAASSVPSSVNNGLAQAFGIVPRDGAYKRRREEYGVFGMPFKRM
ncbi:hypothetical protein QBC36DRAFT_295097 [Triangularia setosa]|uniref:Uncharacterized protein n=1 Tax=Triangularia setosa TaxID=2587417 RepID=A0AAN6W002_9PEZI|nr:hypothetical protein QBC36DRAFT_295097 [Podospora setosa]